MVPFIVADVETTGKRSPSAQVIEAGAVALDESFREVEAFNVLANPGEEALRVASPQAMEKNGITLDEIRGGLPIEEAARQFAEFRARYPGATVHAYNNGFDAWFLARSPWLVSAKSWGECILLASMEIMKDAAALETFKDGTAKWPSLKAAAEYFGVPYGNGHRALHDARVAAGVMTAIERLRSGGSIQAGSEASHILEEGF